MGHAGAPIKTVVHRHASMLRPSRKRLSPVLMADIMRAQRRSERDRLSAVVMIYASFAQASGGGDVGLWLSWQGVQGRIGV